MSDLILNAALMQNPYRSEPRTLKYLWTRDKSSHWSVADRIIYPKIISSYNSNFLSNPPTYRSHRPESRAPVVYGSSLLRDRKKTALPTSLMGCFYFRKVVEQFFNGLYRDLLSGKLGNSFTSSRWKKFYLSLFRHPARALPATSSPALALSISRYAMTMT